MSILYQYYSFSNPREMSPTRYEAIVCNSLCLSKVHAVIRSMLHCRDGLLADRCPSSSHTEGPDTSLEHFRDGVGEEAHNVDLQRR